MCVPVPVLDVVVVECKGVTGDGVSGLQESSLPTLSSSSISFPPRCTSQSELHQSSHSKPRIRVIMHDGRADIDEQDIFVHVDFDPAYFHIVFLLCDRLKSAGFLVRH